MNSVTTMPHGDQYLCLAEWPIYETGAHGRFATSKPKNLARIAPQGLPATVPETLREY